jgi:hypothetical protein
LKNGFKGHIKNTGALFGVLGTLGGFFSDVLQPIAPFSSYLFFATAFSTVTIILMMIFISGWRTKVIPAFIFSFTLMVSSGLLYSLQSEETQSTGVLADQIKILKNIQSSMGLVHQDLLLIKEGNDKFASNLKENTEATREVTQAVKETSVQIVESLEFMRSEFSSLNSSGGIISNPTRPEQAYHNARIYELNGDYGNARLSYNQYFAYKLDFVDPHIRYQTFLKVQEGRAGAQEIYSAIYENDQRPVVEFARILLYAPPQRTKMLQDFITKNPDFSPAYYELSQEFSSIRKGVQSLNDKRNELDALKKFKRLNSEGKFLKYFIDNEFATKWEEDAEKRLRALSLVAEMTESNSVTLSAMNTSIGWNINLSLLEKSREIFYRLEGTEDFSSLEHYGQVDPSTGLKIPKNFFYLPKEVKKAKLYVKYLDINNNEVGPFELDFDMLKLHKESEVKLLKQLNTAWVNFRKQSSSPGNRIVYMYITAAGRWCGLKEIWYGIDKEIPDKKFPIIEECDLDKLEAGHAETMLELPVETEFASLRLVFFDGQMSEVKKFYNIKK